MLDFVHQPYCGLDSGLKAFSLQLSRDEPAVQGIGFRRFRVEAGCRSDSECFKVTCSATA